MNRSQFKRARAGQSCLQQNGLKSWQRSSLSLTSSFSANQQSNNSCLPSNQTFMPKARTTPRKQYPNVTWYDLTAATSQSSAIQKIIRLQLSSLVSEV